MGTRIGKKFTLNVFFFLPSNNECVTIEKTIVPEEGKQLAKRKFCSGLCYKLFCKIIKVNNIIFRYI